MDKIPNALIIGSVMYAILCIREDVSHALNITSIYQANPSGGHWIAMKNILKYLIRTKDVFLVYVGGELQVRGYADASFQIGKDDSKLQNVYIFTLNDGAVSWKSSK